MEDLSRSMRTRLGKADRRLRTWGLDGRSLIAQARSVPQMRADWKELARQRRDSPRKMDFQMTDSYRIGHDVSAGAAAVGGHYLTQDLLVAQAIHAARPERHLDIGSSVYGFVSHVASFRPVEVIDIRPLDVPLPNVTFHQMDVLDAVREVLPADSVSCLHALEHFGLGRYGDQVSFDGWVTGLEALSDLTSPGGTLYISVPTGLPQRIEFNAHRVFSLPYFFDALNVHFEVERLDFLPDSGAPLLDVDWLSAEASLSFGANYGCAIWTCTRAL